MHEHTGRYGLPQRFMLTFSDSVKALPTKYWEKKRNDLSCLHALLNLMMRILHRPLAICFSVLSLNMAESGLCGRCSNRLCKQEVIMLGFDIFPKLIYTAAMDVYKTYPLTYGTRTLTNSLCISSGLYYSC